MTTLIILLVLAIAADLVVTMRTVRHDKPREAPPSHRDWSSGVLPSHPYTAA